MSTSTLTVRPLATPGDVDLFHQLAADAFLDTPAPDAAARWRRRIEEIPGFQPELLRGVYRGDTLLGGHVLYDRILRIGPARLRTDCIGAVVTHPDYRHQGAAAALLRDTTSMRVHAATSCSCSTGSPTSTIASATPTWSI